MSLPNYFFMPAEYAAHFERDLRFFLLNKIFKKCVPWVRFELRGDFIFFCTRHLDRVSARKLQVHNDVATILRYRFGNRHRRRADLSAIDNIQV